MIVRVVISRATRVPCFSLALSTLDLQPTTYRGPEDAFTMTVMMIRQYLFIDRALILPNTYIARHPAASALPLLFARRFVVPLCCLPCDRNLSADP